MVLFRGDKSSMVFAYSSLGLAACGGLLLSVLCSLPSASSRARAAADLSQDESFRLRPSLRTSGETLVAFYARSSALERATIARLAQLPALRDGVRRIALDSLA